MEHVSTENLIAVAVTMAIAAGIPAPLYAALMLVARGLLALLLYRADLSFAQCIGLALHPGTQLSMVVAITRIAVHRGLTPGVQGATLVGSGILTTVRTQRARDAFCGRNQLRVPLLHETTRPCHLPPATRTGAFCSARLLRCQCRRDPGAAGA